MGNSNQKSSADKGYKIAVIGDTSSGKTMLLLGLILTSKNGLTERLTVVSDDHQDEITEMRKHLQKGVVPAGTTILTSYTLALQRTTRFCGICGRKTSTYPLVFRDYKGGDIKDGISFFDQKFGDCDGVLFLMNPGQSVLNLGKTEDADDAALSMLTNLINGISGSSGDRKCRATAMAAAVTAMDRIRKGGDLYAHRSKFFDAFNRYIVNPLKTNASGIACKTDFKISVTGHVESQEKISRIDSRNNAAAPFLWLIDHIDRKKHPIRYWTRRLWLVFLLGALAVFGCLTWWWQHSRVDEINEKGEYAFKRAQIEFCSATTIASYREYVGNLSNCVSNLERQEPFFPDAKEKKNVAYTNLLAKYLLMEADAAFLKMKESVNDKDKQKPDADQAYALRITNLQIDTPNVFDHYTAQGFTQEVANATNRLAEHLEKKVPEVVSEYNEKYFEARFDMLETNAARVASQEYIQGLTNELAVWKQECSAISTWSNNIERISSRIVARCPAWRAAFASNIVQSVKSFEYEVKEHPDEIFLFGKKKLGPKLRELLTVEETADQLNLDSAKKGLLKACRESYFEQKQFKTDAERYPEDSKLRDNLDRLLQGTTLTNCVSEWMSDLHDKQQKWLRAEVERVKDKMQNAQDYSKFLTRPREGTGDGVHSLLVNCWKWAKEEADDKTKTIFDTDCTNVWVQFIARYFTEKKWKLGDDYKYPIAEDNLEDKIGSFLENTRLDVKDATSKWLSKMREMQKQWLMDAMEDSQKFPDGFDAFKDDGSGDDIKRVLVAAQSFINEPLSEEKDLEWINTVKEKREGFLAAMKTEYFKDEKFAPSHEFSLKDGERWFDRYRSAEKEMLKGLQRIFVPETGYDINKVTNECVRILWQHERDWLDESKNMCTNEVAKFPASERSNAIVDFVTRQSGNPFLWQYVTGVKENSNDFGVSQFKEGLQSYAEQAPTAAEFSTLQTQYRTLRDEASLLVRNAGSMNCQYAGLYDIFALRHLGTNGVSACIIERSSVRGHMGVNGILENIKGLADKLLDDSWLSTEYRIKKVIVTLEHPDGVVQYRPRTKWKWQLNQDRFVFSVEEGSVDDIDFLPSPRVFEDGSGRQASPSCTGTVEVYQNKQLKLFSDMKFSGTLREEYTRDAEEKGRSDRNPDPVGSEKEPRTWNVVIHVPHLQSASGALVKSDEFYYNSRANRWTDSDPPTQKAALTVSVDGEVVGSTPYDRIEACIKKAQEMESDNSNIWLQRCREAEERLEELNKILSGGDESDVGGQP